MWVCGSRIVLLQGPAAVDIRDQLSAYAGGHASEIWRWQIRRVSSVM